MSEPMFVYLLLCDDDVVGVYLNEMLAETDMALFKQGDDIAGRSGVQYLIERRSIIKEV